MNLQNNNSYWVFRLSFTFWVSCSYYAYWVFFLI